MDSLEKTKRDIVSVLNKINVKTTSAILGENLKANSEKTQYIIYIEDKNVNINDEDLATYIEETLGFDVISIKHFALKDSSRKEIWIFFEFA